MEICKQQSEIDYVELWLEWPLQFFFGSIGMDETNTFQLKFLT